MISATYQSGDGLAAPVEDTDRAILASFAAVWLMSATAILAPRSAKARQADLTMGAASCQLTWLGVGSRQKALRTVRVRYLLLSQRRLRAAEARGLR
jgi:hypothetical protein